MLKDTIKKIPVLRNLIISAKRAFLKRVPFETSRKYWIERYEKGGNSGAGSYNDLAVFKGEIVNSFVCANNINSVIEFGCGNGNQLKYMNFNSYTGYDISPKAIAICSNMYKSDKTKQFKLMVDHQESKADLTLSLDVIYHLVEDDTYNEYMNLLFSSSGKYVIIYSSNSDEHENNEVAPHVKHRGFTKWIEKNRPDFKLIDHIPNKYPYNGDGNTSSYSDFYIFKRSENQDKKQRRQPASLIIDLHN